MPIQDKLRPLREAVRGCWAREKGREKGELGDEFGKGVWDKQASDKGTGVSRATGLTCSSNAPF